MSERQGMASYHVISVHQLHGSELQIRRQDPSVRLASVQAILTLYREPQHVAPMEAFARRFRDRFIEMANDKDPEVAESAIAMVNRLLLYVSLTHCSCCIFLLT